LTFEARGRLKYDFVQIKSENGSYFEINQLEDANIFEFTKK
jgi:hypothetical protein